MSKFAEYETTMKDPKFLVEALGEMGFVVERHNQAQTLYGYHGDERAEKAHIIIRRHNTGIGASNDVGFVLNESGNFQAIISEYDRSQKFNEGWLGLVKQRYQEKKTIAAAKVKGYVFQGREIVNTAKGQQVKLRFAAR